MDVCPITFGATAIVQLSPPVPVSAVIETGYPRVTITFDQPLLDSTPDPTNFTFEFSGSLYECELPVAIIGNQIILYGSLDGGGSGTVVSFDDSGGDFYGASGLLVPSFTDFPASTV